MKGIIEHIAAVLCVAALLVACSASFAPDRPAPPCGFDGVQCVGHTCCGRSEVCGGAANFQPSCPESMCCYVGGDWIGAAHRPNTPQRKASP